MSTTMSLPELGENVESALVVKVLVAAGDRIERDQPVIEVETEKASVEVPATVSGTVSELHVAEGEQIRSGEAILTLADDDDATDAGSTSQTESGGSPPDPDRDDEPWPEAAKADAEGPPTASEPAAAGGGESPELQQAEADRPTDEAPAEREIVVRLPELGENVDGADVVKLLVAVGDRVEEGQGILELETEKATVEVPSSASGVVQAVHVSEGDRITSGTELMTVRGRGSASAAAPAAAATDAATGSGEEMGPRPPAEPIAPSDPPTSRTGGPATREQVAPLWSGSPTPRKRVPAAPSVRRFARELGIDITEVSGTGQGGRITSEDVKEHVKASLVRSSGGAQQAPALPDFSRWGEVSFEEMTSIRRITAEQMARAWHTVPQVTQHDLADITDLEELRAQYRARIEAAGGKLSLTAILVKVAAAALRVFPNLNASVDMENRRIVRKRYIHIGVAVDTERGLLVPVIRDADRKSIAVIARELDDLAERARNRKLGPDEMQGGTFTISNLGGIGGTAFSPIVNWPEVAILGVSRGRLQPEWKDGQWRPRLMVPLSLSYDHRLVDGADAARFTSWIAEALESPLLLVLEG